MKAIELVSTIKLRCVPLEVYIKYRCNVIDAVTVADEEIDVYDKFYDFLSIDHLPLEDIERLLRKAKEMGNMAVTIPDGLYLDSDGNFKDPMSLAKKEKEESLIREDEC